MTVGNEALSQVWHQIERVRVMMDGKRLELPTNLARDVCEAKPPRGVALVPPNDPYLRQVDRTLLLPDPDRRKRVFRPSSAPGALLIDGEVAGTWRLHRKKSELTVSPFEPIDAGYEESLSRCASAFAVGSGEDEPSIVVM